MKRQDSTARLGGEPLDKEVQETWEKLLRGEADPESKLWEEPGQEGGNYSSEEQQGKLARERSRALQLESDLQQRKRQDNAPSPDRGVQGVVPGPPFGPRNGN